MHFNVPHRDFNLDCLYTKTFPILVDCDPALFENTIQLREKRLDIEEVLVEEKKIADNLRKENDSLAKKVCKITPKHSKGIKLI